MPSCSTGHRHLRHPGRPLLYPPVVDPHAERRGFGPGKPRCAAPEALEGVKPARRAVRQPEVGHVELARPPRARVGVEGRVRRGHGDAEKRQLEAVGPSVVGAEVAGVVPPLGAEIRVRAVVAGKRERLRPECQRVARRVGAHGVGQVDVGRGGRRVAVQPEGQHRQRSEDGNEKENERARAHGVFRISTPTTPMCRGRCCSVRNRIPAASWHGPPLRGANAHHYI